MKGRGGTIGPCSYAYSWYYDWYERRRVPPARGDHRRRPAAARDTPEFVPVLVAEDSTAPAEVPGRIEIALGLAVVRVGADVDAAALRRVLEVVRSLA